MNSARTCVSLRPACSRCANQEPGTAFGVGPDTNDSEFFITSDAYREGDFQYTIIGKLVAGDNIRQAIAAVPVNADGSPVHAPIIDSVSIVPDTNYGLVMLKAGTAATAGETGTVTVTASDAFDRDLDRQQRSELLVPRRRVGRRYAVFE